MDSRSYKSRHSTEIVFPESTPNRHEPLHHGAAAKVEKRPIDGDEIDSLQRWEDEGGRIANQEAVQAQRHLIKL